MVADLESAAYSVGERAGVAVNALRLAPVLGPHVPSPLGRVLRQPVVPFSLLADAPFAVEIIVGVIVPLLLLARASQRANRQVLAGSLWAISTMQAIRRGRRLPLPLVGPEWRIARQISYLLGAPVPSM